MRARLLVLAALSVVSPLTAHADAAKAWATAKGTLPANTALVISANVTAITKSAVFSQILPILLNKQPELKTALDDMKRLCSLDPFTVIQGVVVAGDSDGGAGAIFASVSGLDQPKLAACLQAVAKDKKAPDVTFTKTGNIVEAVADKQKIYYAWLATDVLVFSKDFHDRAELEKWTTGKSGLAKSKISVVIGKVNTAAAMWFANGVEKSFGDALASKQGYGAVKLAAGTVGVELHAGMGTAKDATTAATKVNQQITDFKPNLPDAIANLAKGLTVTPVKDEVVIKLDAAEKDLAPLITMLGMI